MDRFISYVGLVCRLAVAAVGCKQPMGLLLQQTGGLVAWLDEPASQSLPTESFAP